MAVFLEFMVVVAGMLLTAWSWKRMRRKWCLPAGVLAGVLHVMTTLGLPFAGWATESVVALATVVALALVLPIAFHYGPLGAGERWSSLIIPFILLALMVAILMPWTRRLAYAQRVAWSCDGEITLKYRSDNHAMPSIFVQSSEGNASLEGVDEHFWNVANVGDRVEKRPGSVMGRLNDLTLRIVPRTMPWWNEPLEDPESR